MAKRRMGDRRDGRRVRDLDGLHIIMMHIMPKRTEAEVYQEFPLDVTNLLPYLERVNAEHPEYKTTMFHCIIAAAARTVRMRPALNRFICGRHMYERDEISLSFVAKRKFADHAEEALMTVFADDDTNLDSISRKVCGSVKEMRQQESAEGLDDTINIVGHLPFLLVKAIVDFTCFLSEHGKVPKFFSEGDSNHTTILFSNLGSIRCNSCYHHLNNYGTNSIMITVGVIHKEPRVMEDGSIAIRDMVNLGLIADERIADGFYFARSMKLISHLIETPELLEIPLKEEITYEF